MGQSCGFGFRCVCGLSGEDKEYNGPELWVWF